MITVRKLRSLKAGTLRRKTAVILRAFEQDLQEGRVPDTGYLSEFAVVTAEVFHDSDKVAGRALELRDKAAVLEPQALLRALNSLRHEILKELGTEPADWDMTAAAGPADRTEAEGAGGFDGMRIFLDDLRSPFNVGSIFRTSEAFGASEIILSPDCPPVAHPRTRRTSMGCTELVKWRVEALEKILAGGSDETVFALELGGTPVSDFEFPLRGLAVIGSEELGISPEARRAAGNSLGLVSIPIYGRKGSINVSTAFGILMQRWAESVAARTGAGD